MTSPAQLKYLDAMGIPVWVSRDLVTENDLSLDHLATESGHSNTHQNSSQSSATELNHSSNSAQSILESLELDSVKSQSHDKATQQSQNPDQIITSDLNEVVATSVKHAQIPTNDELNRTLLPESQSSQSSSSQLQNNHSLLAETSQHYIYASGCKNPDWMVIGHSPEAFNGIGQEPFASEAGELLNNMLRAAGVTQPRSDAYLLNVIDKNPSDDIDEKIQAEINLTLKNDLLALIDDIKPKVILFVGQIAAQNLLDCEDPLIIMRAKVHTLVQSKIPCVVTYYPSYLLQKPIDKRKAWDDLKLAMKQLNSSDQ